MIRMGSLFGIESPDGLCNRSVAIHIPCSLLILKGNESLDLKAGPASKTHLRVGASRDQARRIDRSYGTYGIGLCASRSVIIQVSSLRRYCNR